MDANAQALVADFSATPVSGCGPLTVTFKDLSSGGPTSWTWDFGNGQVSTAQNPAFNFGVPGQYTITLIVKNKNGAASVRKTNYITVYSYPSVSFTSNLTLACAPANIQFTDKSTPGAGSIAQWNWSFGDGNTSNQQNPAHSYAQPGYYTVGLQVTNSQGCAYNLSFSRYLRVVQGVQPDFAWSQTSHSCSAPFFLNFNNQTSGPGNLSYSWDLGNGNTSTLANPTTSYPANTNYTVTLSAQSDLGCNASVQKTISFPVANPLITSPDSVCLHVPINFTNGSTPVPLSSAWDFGDGNNSTATNPSNTYGAVNAYTVKLVNTYAACLDSTTKTIKVINSPTADFTATSPTVACKPSLTVNFKDGSSIGVSGWQWDFGDGSPISTLQNPSHTYSTAGTFDVKLTVSSGLSCTGTITKPKFVQIAGPSLTLTNGPGQLCAGKSYSPTINANSLDGVASYAWTATGAVPSTSTSATPSFTYASPGNYDIGLTVTTNGGCSTSTTFTNAVEVGSPVSVAFHPDMNPSCASHQLTFTSTTVPADHWIWDFGDGNIAMDTPIVQHYYHDTGTFTINLTVLNHGCATGGTPQTLRILPPIAKFGYTTNCINKLMVNFSDSSIVDPTQTSTYLLNYGDATSSPLITISPGSYPPVFPSHLYPALGSYPATLTVTNSGCSQTYSLNVVLASQVADFSVLPPNPCNNTPFTVSAIGVDTNLVKIYNWKIGSRPFLLVAHDYTTALSDTGIYPIDLIITDINGCSDTASVHHPYTIHVTGPFAKFTPTSAGACRNGPIGFTDSSVPDPSFPLSAWTWDFGDGGSSSTQNPVHNYADTGFFTVKLTVQDQKGCTDTYTDPVPVQVTSPQAGFFAADTLYCPNAPLPFTDSSNGYGLSWAWDFGDGGSSPLENPTHPFSNNGQHYSIKLKVTDQVGCADSITRSNYIHIQSPIAAFTIQDSTTICPPLQTTFIPNPQYYDSLYWEFGDGTTSTLPNTTHFYNTYDTFYAKLFLKGPGGCLDSATRRIFVLNYVLVTSLAYGPPLMSCDSLLVDFTVTPPGFTRFTLLFGDGVADSSENTTPTHLYKSPSSFTPQLIMQDSTGCIVGFGGSQPITILGAVPFFSVDNHAFCDSGTVSFTDFTITNDAPISETWDFGDGMTSTQPNPTHDYTQPGTLEPTLKVTTKSNCTETYTDTIRVYQTPHPLFTFSSQTCAAAPLQFMGNLSQPNPDSVGWAWNFGDGQSSDQQNPVITYRQPGNYLVTLHTSIPFGCGDTTSQRLTLHALPSIKGPAEITAPVGFPTLIPMTYSGGIISYSWTPVTNLSCADCPNPMASPIFNTEYTIMVTDSNDCSITDSVLIKTICNGKNYFIPNTFSPNGDGVNDVFYPRGDNLYNIQTMRVFNRWGQMVFEKRDFPANSAASGWDGTFNGRPAPVDVYAYIVEVVCDNAQVVALSGNVTLVR